MNESKKQEIKTIHGDWVQLTKWNQHFEFPSQGTMRNLCSRRKENGAEAFLSLVNKRFYISVSKFNDWMEKQIILRNK